MIPNVFHFCYGLLPDAEFGFLDYLAIRSALEINRPEEIYLHYQHECSGPWWEKVKAMVTLHRVEAPSEIFGRRIHHYAHRSDVLRLMVLRERGGIYMDIDTLCLRPFTPLLGHRCVLGWQGGRGLCNAVILSEPGGEFINAWLESYRTFRSLGRDGFWDEHSVVVPRRLARQRRLRPHVTILGHRAFFPFSYKMHRLFVSNDPAGFEDSYCVHYCESGSRKRWLSQITPESTATGNTNFCRFARRVLEGEHSEPGRETAAAALSPGHVRTPLLALQASLSRFRWLERLGFYLRWLSWQSRDLVWLPRLVRNLGWAPAALYVAQRLRLRAGCAGRGPFVVLRSRQAAHPLRCRGVLDLRAFDRVFVSCRYECLEDIDRVGLIVDCGAHVGYASAYLLTRFPGSKLIALEPNPDHFAVLQANLAPYGDRCQAVCSAVWSRPAGLVFEETASGPAHKVRRRVRPARPNEVPAMNVTDLGTLLEKGGFERISILRLNIGGAESAVFAANYESWIGKVDHLAIDLHGEECRRTFLNAISSETFVVSQGKETTYCRRPG